MDTPWIIDAKFDPPRQHGRQIERLRLVERIRAAEAGPVVIQAPAGFGKSTLLGEWARQAAREGMAVAWLNLDEDDRAPEPFAAYLVAALRRALGPDAPAEGASTLYAGASPRNALAALLSTIGRTGRPVVLALDDYHRAESEAVDALLRGFIERAAPLIRVAVASRSLPRLGLSRWKAEGRLLLVTDRDLRFNEGETSLFFAADPESAGRPELTRFARRAEGWPVALQFARLWLDEGRDLAALSAASEAGDLGAYLSEQVFAALGPDERAFLLLTSPLDIVSEGIAEAVGVPHARAIVRALARSTLPITILSPEPMRFRYHHLLRDFLRARAGAEGIDLGAVHRRAARWFSASGDLSSAVRHALAGEDAGYAASVVEDAGGWRLVYTGQGHLRVILRSVAAALDPAGGDYARLRLGAAVLAAKSGDVAGAARLFRQIEGARDPADAALGDEVAVIDALIRLYCDAPLGEAALAALAALSARMGSGDPIGLALATNLVAFFTLQKGQYLKARRFGEQAIEQFRRAGATFGELHLYAHVGAAQLATGNRQAAALAYRTMRDLSRRALGPGSDLEAIADVLDAETAYEADERVEARRLIGAALERIEGADSWFDVFAAGYVTAARLELADHGPAAALAALDRGRGTAAARDMRRLERLLDEERLRTATLAKDLDAAGAACRRLGLPLTGAAASECPPPVSALRGDGPALAAARLLVASGREGEALALLDAAEGDMRRHGAPVTRQITAQVLRALAESGLERAECAAATLAAGVRLAARERFVRSLLDEGPRCRDLLGELAASERTAPETRALIWHILRRGGPAPPPLPGAPSFSARERQIVALLAQGFSNKEIARAIALDPNTVKYHLKRLFAKLAVERRAQAVIRARQHGLIG